VGLAARREQMADSWGGAPDRANGQARVGMADLAVVAGAALPKTAERRAKEEKTWEAKRS